MITVSVPETNHSPVRLNSNVERLIDHQRGRFGKHGRGAEVSTKITRFEMVCPCLASSSMAEIASVMSLKAVPAGSLKAMMIAAVPGERVPSPFRLKWPST